MAEDLRIFENPRIGWEYEGPYVLRLTKSALFNNNDVPPDFKKEVVEIEQGRIYNNVTKIDFYDVVGSGYPFSFIDVIDVRKKDGTPLWVNHDYVCPVCGLISLDYAHDHLIRVASAPGNPLGIVIDVQFAYPDSGMKSYTLAHALAELKRFFPGKQFTILPSKMMLTKEGANNVLLGEAHVAEYIAVEI